MRERRSVIRELLDERGIKYSHFARRIGIAAETFSRIESGVQPPTANYYQKAAIFLNVDEARLVPDPVEVPA